MRHLIIPLLCLVAFAGASAQEATPVKPSPAAQCLSNAKQIVLACRLYASDNDGKFPAKLGDLVPTYISDTSIFASPLSAKKEAMGFEYLGAGATDSDDAGKIILRSKDLTADGKRIIVHADGSGEIKADK